VSDTLDITVGSPVVDITDWQDAVENISLSAPSVTHYYVATTGDDDLGTGSISAPFLTIGKAKSIVAADIAAGLTGDVLVFLRGGTYRIIATEVFDADDFDPVFRVVYLGFPGETVILNGSKVITETWVDDGGGLWHVDLSGQAVFQQLVIDGVLATRARWPKYGSYHLMEEYRDLNLDPGPSGTDEHTASGNSPDLIDGNKSWDVDEWVGSYVTNVADGSFGLITANTSTLITATLAGGTDNDWDTNDAYTIEDDLPNNTFTGRFDDYFRWDQAIGDPGPTLNAAGNPEIEVVTFSDFITTRHRLLATTTNPGLVQLKDDHQTAGGLGWASQRHYGRYFYENALTFVTEPGDWYYDEVIDRLHYRPRAWETPATMVAEIPTATTLILVQGTVASIPAFLTGDFTISAWFRANTSSIPGDFNRMGIVSNNQGQTAGFELSLRTTTADGAGHISFSHAGTLVAFTEQIDMNDGVWYHVVASIDQTANTCEIYIDGASIATPKTILADAFLNTAPGIGRSASGLEFWGELDDVLVLTGTTDTDVAAAKLKDGDYSGRTIVFNMPMDGDYETNCTTIAGVGHQRVASGLYSNPTFINGGTGHNPCLSLDGVDDRIDIKLYPGAQVSNLHFINLTITGIDRGELTDFWSNVSIEYETKIEAAIKFEYAKDCSVVGCTISDCAGTGVWADISENISVSSNTLFNLGYCGIVFSGPLVSSRMAFISEKKWEGHTANNNTIYDIGMARATSAAIYFLGVSNSKANNNLMWNLPNNGIQCHLGHDAFDRGFTNVEIKQNRIRDCMQLLADGGAIVINGNITGGTINHNNIRDVIRTAHHGFGRTDLTAPFGFFRAMHVDTGGRGWTIEKNIFNRFVNGINFHDCGLNMAVENNVFVDPEATGESACFVLNNQNKIEFTNELPQDSKFMYPMQVRYNIYYTDTGLEGCFKEAATSPADKTAIFAQASDGYDIIDFNLYSHDEVRVRINNLGRTVDYDLAYLQSLRTNTAHPPGNYAGLEIEANSVIGDPLFTDYANEDFAVKAGSPALALGFKNFTVPAFPNDPSSIPSIVSWWDVNDVSTILKGDSENVRTLLDKIGNTNLSQSVDAQRPTLTTLGPNNLVAMLFDGGSDGLTAALTAPQPFEVWLALQFTKIDDPSQHIWAGAVANVVQAEGRDSNKIRVRANGTTDATDLSPITLNTPMVLRFLYNDDLSQIWKDNVVQFTDTPIQNIGTDGISFFCLGCQATFSNGLNGSVSECFVVDGELSAAEVTKMWTYMNRSLVIDISL